MKDVVERCFGILFDAVDNVDEKTNKTKTIPMKLLRFDADKKRISAFFLKKTKQNKTRLILHVDWPIHLTVK